jgi:hypothetical protein
MVMIEDQMKDFVDAVKESIESMQEAIKMISLGIDYRRYSRFKLLSPLLLLNYVSRSYESAGNRRNKPLVREDCQFCIDFVIQCSLRLQDFDYSI